MLRGHSKTITIVLGHTVFAIKLRTVPLLLVTN